MPDNMTTNASPSVSIIIPTKNNASVLENLLASIHRQTYRNIETIIVDGSSTDGTVKIANRFGVRIVDFDSGVVAGRFDAPHRRNYGVQMSTGEFVYYVDADMELDPETVSEAVELCNSGFAAVIVGERSFGVGPWAAAKALERSSYLGDDVIEAPRFFARSIWDEVGGLDQTLFGGGDDWDLHEAVKSAGYSVGRTRSVVMHNEGELRLSRLIRKRYMYGKDSWRYLKKRPGNAVHSYFPIRAAYFRNWRSFIRQPKTTVVFVVMRLCEYGAGLMGVVVGLTLSRTWARNER